jgi:hypothetical protein
MLIGQADHAFRRFSARCLIAQMAMRPCARC